MRETRGLLDIPILRRDEDGGVVEAHPIFAACMEERGWELVSDEVFLARRLKGQAEECLAGQPDGCSEVVNRYVHGVDGDAALLEQKTGLELGETLCGRGDGDVCLTMSSLFLHATDITGLPRSPTLALSYARRGCDARSARSCGFAGMLLSTDHEGLVKDPAAGQIFLDRACELGQVTACAREAPAVALPDGQRWCDYGLLRVDGDACPSVQVGRVGLDEGDACRQQITLELDRCRYTFGLGEAAP